MTLDELFYALKELGFEKITYMNGDLCVYHESIDREIRITQADNAYLTITTRTKGFNTTSYTSDNFTQIITTIANCTGFDLSKP